MLILVMVRQCGLFLCLKPSNFINVDEIYPECKRDNIL